MPRRRRQELSTTVCMDLSEGASVTLTFKGNLFYLKSAEWNLMNDLTSVIKAYRDSGSLNQTSAKEA